MEEIKHLNKIFCFHACQSMYVEYYYMCQMSQRSTLNIVANTLGYPRYLRIARGARSESWHNRVCLRGHDILIHNDFYRGLDRSMRNTTLHPLVDHGLLYVDDVQDYKL